MAQASFQLTPKQDRANKLLGGAATHVLLYGGSRSGKTFLLCRAMAIRALRSKGSLHAILRHRFNAVKQSVWYQTWPRMMEACFPGVPWKPNQQDHFVELPGKSQVWFGGLDDKERTEKILGNEYATILINEASQVSLATREIVRTRLAQNCGLKLRMYYDENPPRKTHWSYRLFIQKRDPEPPFKPLGDADDYACLQMNPEDNRANLPDGYIEKQLGTLSARQRVRFLHGEFGDAAEGELWSLETIEANRVTKTPQLQRIVVAVDPSGTKGEEDDRSDMVGIIVVGVGMDGHGYVLEDLTCKAPPAVWGRVAVTAFSRWQANAVVGEINYGGAMVEHVVKTAAQAEGIVVPYIEVTASRGKAVRAEPVAALYEQGKVHHVGVFSELEDQMLDFTTAGYMGDRSPDRVDALVWALSEMFPGLVAGPKPARPSEILMPVLSPLDGF